MLPVHRQEIGPHRIGLPGHTEEQPVTTLRCPISPNQPESKKKDQLQESLHLACLAAQTIEEMRGQDAVVLDLTRITPIADYFVIATGTSSRQMRSSAGEVHRLFKEAGSSRLGLEGEGSNSWILQDFGDIVVHLFTREARDLYDLENLWGDAPRVEWKSLLEKSSRAAKGAPKKKSSSVEGGAAPSAPSRGSRKSSKSKDE